MTEEKKNIDHNYVFGIKLMCSYYSQTLRHPSLFLLHNNCPYMNISHAGMAFLLNFFFSNYILLTALSLDCFISTVKAICVVLLFCLKLF